VKEDKTIIEVQTDTINELQEECTTAVAQYYFLLLFPVIIGLLAIKFFKLCKMDKPMSGLSDKTRGL